ncbi:hypothetical protein DM01DRAFT_1406787 [Hesseltinella vesiculosa]|uniref:Uncharacterized protein n=1 Tax=Hesseltinella vesiculosa TaxID=101127 RepID=A0A1X2GJV6_9FUNG|nr:hypothetical protein DM01DRAFT_1406787 [Hesseltinella vesiculosa]
MDDDYATSMGAAPMDTYVSNQPLHTGVRLRDLVDNSDNSLVVDLAANSGTDKQLDDLYGPFHDYRLPSTTHHSHHNHNHGHSLLAKQIHDLREEIRRRETERQSNPSSPASPITADSPPANQMATPKMSHTPSSFATLASTVSSSLGSSSVLRPVHGGATPFGAASSDQTANKPATPSQSLPVSALTTPASTPLISTTSTNIAPAQATDKDSDSEEEEGQVDSEFELQKTIQNLELHVRQLDGSIEVDQEERRQLSKALTAGEHKAAKIREKLQELESFSLTAPVADTNRKRTSRTAVPLPDVNKSSNAKDYRPSSPPSTFTPSQALPPAENTPLPPQLPPQPLPPMAAPVPPPEGYSKWGVRDLEGRVVHPRVELMDTTSTSHYPSKKQHMVPSVKDATRQAASQLNARSSSPQYVVGMMVTKPVAPPASETTDLAMPNGPKPTVALPNWSQLLSYTNDVCKMIRLRVFAGISTSQSTAMDVNRPRPSVQQVYNINNISTILPDMHFYMPPRGSQDSANTENEPTTAVDTSYASDRLSYSVVCYMLTNGTRLMVHVPLSVRSKLNDILAILDKKMDFISFVSKWHDNHMTPISSAQKAALDQAIQALRVLTQIVPNYELIWIMYTELVFIQERRYEIRKEHLDLGLYAHPYSVDLYWTIFTGTPDLLDRIALAKEALALYAHQSINATPEFAADLSQNTVELLLRVMAVEGAYTTMQLVIGLDQTQSLFMGDNGLPSGFCEVSLNSQPDKLFMTDHDLCYLWMNFVYVLICESAPPSSVRSPWFDRMNVDGTRRYQAFPLFLIDWSVLDTYPLSRQEQRAVVSVLLCMVSYFTTRASTNASKRPLMALSWQCLWRLLAHLSCYQSFGTLLLLSHGDADQTVALQPELWSEQLALENLQTAVDPKRSVWNNIQQSLLTKRTNPISGQTLLTSSFFLGVRSTLVTLTPNGQLKVQPSEDKREEFLPWLELAWRLGRPLWLLYKNETLDRLDRMQSQILPTKHEIYDHISYLCGLYSTALGIDKTFSILLQDGHATVTSVVSIPFAWMALILIHYLQYQVKKDGSSWAAYENSLYKTADLGTQACQDEGLAVLQRFIAGAFGDKDAFRP